MCRTQRHMPLTQVSWHLAEGLHSFRSFLDMLREVAIWCKASIKEVASWDRMGFELDKKYWVGVIFEEPDQIRFQTIGCQIGPQAATALGIGAVLEKEWAPGDLVWRRVENLASEEVHFYARSKLSQVQYLDSFLRESLDLARKIERPE